MLKRHTHNAMKYLFHYNAWGLPLWQAVVAVQTTVIITFITTIIVHKICPPLKLCGYPYNVSSKLFLFSISLINIWLPQSISALFQFFCTIFVVPVKLVGCSKCQDKGSAIYRCLEVFPPSIWCSGRKSSRLLIPTPFFFKFVAVIKCMLLLGINNNIPHMHPCGSFSDPLKPHRFQECVLSLHYKS